MFKLVVAHMKAVEAAINRMSTRPGFAFALSCTERQWPVFERALNEEPNLTTGLAVFRKAIDLAWEHCLHGIPVPNEYLAECRRGIPEQVGDARSAVAHTISNSVVDLLNAIQRSDGTYPHLSSGRNLGLIELLLDEHGLLLDNLTEDEAHDVTEIKPIRILMNDEIQQQNMDLQRLTTDPSSSTIEAIKKESSGKSLFKNVWFLQ
jgi:hypothetical protein